MTKNYRNIADHRWLAQDNLSDCAANIAYWLGQSGVGFSGLTLNDGSNIAVGTGTGTKIGTAASQKLGFYNATPVVQPVGAAQAAVAATGSTNSSPYGYTTAAQADAIVTLVNALRAALVAEGLIKGAA